MVTMCPGQLDVGQSHDGSWKQSLIEIHPVILLILPFGKLTLLFEMAQSKLLIFPFQMVDLSSSLCGKRLPEDMSYAYHNLPI